MKNNVGVQAIVAQGTKPTATGAGGTCAVGSVVGGAIGGTLPLPAGASATINTQAAIYGIAANGTQTIGVMETF